MQNRCFINAKPTDKVGFVRVIDIFKLAVSHLTRGLFYRKKLVDKLPRFVEIHTAFRSGFFAVNTCFDALASIRTAVIREYPKNTVTPMSPTAKSRFKTQTTCKLRFAQMILLLCNSDIALRAVISSLRSGDIATVLRLRKISAYSKHAYTPYLFVRRRIYHIAIKN